jgi:hypothetical protein
MKAMGQDVSVWLGPAAVAGLALDLEKWTAAVAESLTPAHAQSTTPGAAGT